MKESFLVKINTGTLACFIQEQGLTDQDTARKLAQLICCHFDLTRKSSYVLKPHDVHRLREMTGQGMLDCQRALLAADGDIEEAVRIVNSFGKM